MNTEEIKALGKCTKSEILIWLAIEAKPEIGQNEISIITGLGVGDIQRGSANLKSRGMLETVKRGGCQVNTYRIKIPLAQSLEEAGIVDLFLSLHRRWASDPFTRWCGSTKWFSRSAEINGFDDPAKHEKVKNTISLIDQWMEGQQSLRLLFPDSVVPIWRGSDWMTAIPRVINGGKIWITYG